MTTDQANLILSAALEYAAMGWHVVPLLARDKRPRINAWQREASSDEDKVCEWFDRWPDSNVGIRLGEASGIIDVECDDDEAEQTLFRLFDGDCPATATFAAARGKHRLFRWCSDLPEPHKAVFRLGKLEFRTGNGHKGAQSVFPPSIHPSGARYRWLVHPSECGVAEFPREVIARLYNWCGEDAPLFEERSRRTKEHWDRVAAGVAEGQRNDDAASLVGRMLREMSDCFNNDAVSFQWGLAVAWNRSNRPPLDERELRATFESILKRERLRRTNDVYEREFARDALPKWDGANKKDDGWRLVILDTKPRSYRLYSPLWTGFVELTSDDLLSAARVRREAMEQKDRWLPTTFRKLWEGTNDAPPLGRQLIEAAELIQVAPERHRDKVIADLLLEQIDKAREIDEGQAPDSRGKPTRLPDGSVVFSFNYVWRELSYSADKVRRTELSSVLESCHAIWYRAGSDRTRLKHITREGLSKLRDLSRVAFQEAGTNESL